MSNHTENLLPRTPYPPFDIRISAFGFAEIESWNHANVNLGSWLLYWNRKSGAALTANGMKMEMNPSDLFLIPPLHHLFHGIAESVSASLFSFRRGSALRPCSKEDSPFPGIPRGEMSSAASPVPDGNCTRSGIPAAGLRLSAADSGNRLSPAGRNRSGRADPPRSGDHESGVRIAFRESGNLQTDRNVGKQFLPAFPA